MRPYTRPMHRGRQFDSYTEKIHEPSNHRLGREHEAGNPAAWQCVSKRQKTVRPVGSHGASVKFYRIDVPGKTKQVAVRPALGFCRDKMAAMLKLHQVMQEAGVLDVEKI